MFPFRFMIRIKNKISYQDKIGFISSKNGVFFVFFIQTKMG
ncbi:hypothetical protein LEP1GSC062_1190 [Leptospira alexanderi serovar Manhao 3 str. L 60]|uniref:Uncharacterized protein n=1 Tax=Leptospira alexanderi serovar Manhao 3 str. L 60 TaxID=1049759 RepID=V6I7Y9_9LEPT|nr:hypothetical protein LEP1GSC062_1190 [Leptospira alexanderi serovar Manhao 3 str. L 60]